MAVGKITKEKLDASYRQISEYETKRGIDKKILSHLTLLLFVSQSEEATSGLDFLSGRNLSITESFEDLNASYELIKMELNKQSFISLRVGLDNGLMAAYWKAVGYKSKQFSGWLQSKVPTPKKDKEFWKAIKSLKTVSSFFQKYPLEENIIELNELSDYVHSRGSLYSTFTNGQRQFQSGDHFIHFEKWWAKFQDVFRIIIIMQLLVNPKLTLSIPSEVLLHKFGTFYKIPFMGILPVDYSETIKEIVGKFEYDTICSLASDTSEVKSLYEYLGSLPNLSDDQINRMIFEEQKQNIKDLGFTKWFKQKNLYDPRISEEISDRLRQWFENNETDS